MSRHCLLWLIQKNLALLKKGCFKEYLNLFLNCTRLFENRENNTNFW